jgi:hypothetical protein
MEELRDLNKLAGDVVKNFNDNFNANDCKIPQAFKDKVKSLKSFSVVYNDYSVVIKGDGIRSKDSYVPNQSFYMASFFIEYSNELSKYKQKILPLISNAGISNNELTSFFTHERDDGKGDIERGEDKFVKILDNIGYNSPDRDFLIKFVTDYSWWSGSKTIERSDFFNSPVLSIMGLTASSNAAMALIVDHLTQHPELTDILLNQAKNEKKLNMDKESLQRIFYGAPGTGKSHEVKKLTGEWISEDEERDLPNVFRITFHPDTDYASFVGCYKPTMKPTSKEEKTLTGKDEEIVYEFVPQVFTDSYVYAYNNSGQPTYLVIEEINRGNCAQIFGDLFQLLDRKGGVSEYKIKADKDLAKYLNEAKDKDGQDVLKDKEGIKDGKLCLPANLHILATMNTSDQSLFPMDSAFKRRWEWEYVPINYDTTIKSGEFEITIGKETDERKYSWVGFIEKVNEKIFDLTQSEDKQMGNFFIKQSIDEKGFKSKVMFYLWYEVLRDETENNKYFFYKKTSVEGKDVLSKFTFKDLFGVKATETLQQFMEYLEVAPK